MIDDESDLCIVYDIQDIEFPDFLGSWNYPSDDHTRGYTTKGTYDIYWGRVQNIAHIMSDMKRYDYSDTFMFSAIIEFYSSKIFNTTLDSGVTCLEAVNEIGFYRRVIYNNKMEEKDVTEYEEDTINMVFDDFRSNVADNTTKRKIYSVHHCKVNSMIDRMYGRMSNLGMKMVDLTNLIVIMAAIECDKYLSTKNKEHYTVIMRSFFDSVEKLHKSVAEELN